MKRASATIVVQPTAYCNLDCSYCYLPGRDIPGNMSSAVMESIVRTVFKKKYANHIRFLWHAGEPLAAKRSFYEMAFSLIETLKPDDVEVDHRIQTNAVLINDKWCELFKKYKVAIGVSIDGPNFLNDKYRKDLLGNGSHEKTMKGIACLKHHEIAFNVICVVTKDSLRYAKEIYEFFVKNNIKQVSFNPEQIEGVHETSSLQNLPSGSYGEFLSQFFDLVYAEHPACISVREFINPLSYLKLKLDNPSFSIRRPEQKDLGIITFSKEGWFTSFSPELIAGYKNNPTEFILGHVNDIDDIPSILNIPAYQDLKSKIEKGIKQCAQVCRYFDYCGGGSPGNKIQEHGSFDSTETLYCVNARQIPLNCIQEKIAS